MNQFDQDISLTSLSDGNYSVAVPDTWTVNVGPNGGYIGAVLLNAMMEELFEKTGDNSRQVRSITFHFLSPPVSGPASLHVVTDKIGRSLATLTARLIQQERVVAMALATFAPAREQLSFREFNMPEVPAPEDIPESQRMNPDMMGHSPFRDHYDQRLTIGPIPPATSPVTRVGGWTRFKYPRIVDSLAIIAISDSWFPSIFAKDLPESVHAPTIDHSVHFFTSLPLDSMTDEDFVLVEFTTDIVQEGFLQEDGRIWSPEGELIAQTRQLAVLLTRE